MIYLIQQFVIPHNGYGHWQTKESFEDRDLATKEFINQEVYGVGMWRLTTDKILQEISDMENQKL